MGTQPVRLGTQPVRPHMPCNNNLARVLCGPKAAGGSLPQAFFGRVHIDITHKTCTQPVRAHMPKKQFGESFVRPNTTHAQKTLARHLHNNTMPGIQQCCRKKALLQGQCWRVCGATWIFRDLYIGSIILHAHLSLRLLHINAWTYSFPTNRLRHFVLPAACFGDGAEMLATRNEQRKTNVIKASLCT